MKLKIILTLDIYLEEKDEISERKQKKKERIIINFQENKTKNIYS